MLIGICCCIESSEAPMIDWHKLSTNLKKHHYKRLGKGSGRVVYDLEDGTVVKVAKNMRGMAQNKVESNIYKIHPAPIFAQIINVSDNHKYLIMVKAEKVRSIKQVWRYFHVHSVRQFSKLEEISEICHKHDLLLGDLCTAHNWGFIDEKPVIVDYGFTEAVRRKYY